MKNPYRDISAAILRFASDFASQHGLTALNLDAHADPESWPEGDFIGPSDVMIDFREGEIKVTLAFVVSTRSDTNLHRMDEIVNNLINELELGSRILVRDAVLGTPKGFLITHMGIRAGSVLNTETQPAKPVFVNLISDLALLRS